MPSSLPVQVRQPCFYITHGGGPCFWMRFPPPIGAHGFDRLKDYLAGLESRLPARPRAWLVISAHWEEEMAVVSTSPAPGMLYDYYGFPPHTYELVHAAPGSPALAARILELLADAAIPAREDPQRDFDHGVFVPMKIIDPQAEIPTVMLSLRRDLDPAWHLALGRAIAPLRDEGVVIIGSGSSFHDLRSYFDGRESHAAEAFDTWLAQTAAHADPDVRAGRLLDWTSAPGARAAHPREEHLLPLMVATGAAGADAGVRDYQDHIAGKPFSGFRFG